MVHKSSKRGGSSNYIPSAWDFVFKNVGTPSTQFSNALEIKPGDSLAERSSNVLEPVWNKNYMVGTSGGGKRHKRHGKHRSHHRHRRSTYKKGGSSMNAWGNTIKQALVPFSLWGMQYMQKSRKNPYKSASRRRRSVRKTYKR